MQCNIYEIVYFKTPHPVPLPQGEREKMRRKGRDYEQG